MQPSWNEGEKSLCVGKLERRDDITESAKDV